MPTFSPQDLRFLLSRVRGERLPEELGGLVPQGPTGIRDVQGVGNNTLNQFSPNWWFGAADTLFPRLTGINRLTEPGTKNDVISAPFANSVRGTNVLLSDTAIVGGRFMDALNPRNISNLIGDSSNPESFSSIAPPPQGATQAELADYAAKVKLQQQDNPLTGRLSPIAGAINPLPYSNWMSQFGQFFDHGLDFVRKGVDGTVTVELMPSDGLYTAGRATTITGSRNNTTNVTIGEGSTDALLQKLGLLAQQGAAPSWEITATLGAPVSNNGSFAYQGTLVLNNTIIEIAAIDPTDLVNQINALTPTTGVVASIAPLPAIPGTVVTPGSFTFILTPVRAESFNEVSPFIDLSQNYGSDHSRTFFLREYLSEAEWQAAPGNAGLEASLFDLTTGRLVNSRELVNGEAYAGVANWAEIKANALKVGIILHDADIHAVPLVAIDSRGAPILDANGMPQLVALNKVTGETVYVKDTNVSADLVLMTSKHAFLNDMGVRLPPLSNTSVWSGRDLIDAVVNVPGYGPVNHKTALEAHYIGGDGRLNENIGLTAVHEVFLTEHNRVISELKALYGFTGEQPQGGWTWTDPLTNVTTKVTGEDLFQQAKIWSEMLYQHELFDQFIRKLSPNVAGFAGVDPLIDARVWSEFANAVYRFGHSMLPEAVGMRKYDDATKLATTLGSADVTVTMINHGLKTGAKVAFSSVDNAIGGIAANRLNGEFTITVVDNNTFKFTALPGGNATGNAFGVVGDKIQIDINKGLIEAFLAPSTYMPGTTAGLLADGSNAQVGNRIDEKVTDALRDNLLGQPLDLMTLNLIRGRDAGLPTLNEMRAAIAPLAPVLLQPTLQAYTSWSVFRDNLKGTLAEQNVTVKNFIMAYASDAILTQFQPTKTLQQWYALRESAVVADQEAYMSALKAAAEAAFADTAWMGVNGNKDFNRIDAWIGGLAEREVVGGMLGSTFDAVFAMQMMNLQNGDNFYYLGRIPTQEFFIENMEGVMLADVVMRSTGAKGVYADIFSVADKYIQMGDAGEPARVASLNALQASTTNQRVFDINGNFVNAEIGRAGRVGTNNANEIYYGNPGNYVDARGVLNANGAGNASEMILGTANADRIFSLGGNDTVRAEAGNDTIDGGSGVDFLYGGNGNDTIDGNAEDDFLYGDAGADIMSGGIGIDTMFGGDGDDEMRGGVDGDVMIGGTGNDTMFGADVRDDQIDPLAVAALADDVMNGGQGDDTLYGGSGYDSLSGDSGHDVLVPGTPGLALGGREVMNGGQGDDIYIIENIVDFEFHDIADNGLTQLQLVNKGPAFRQGNGIGVDEVRFTDTQAGDILIGVNAGVGGEVVLGVGPIFTGIERIVIGTGEGTVADRTGTAAINIDASAAVPGVNVGLEILGNAGNNIIIGTAFNDTIDGGGGLDVLNGGLGDDTYIVNSEGEVDETTGGGTDTVVSTVSYTALLNLGQGIDNGIENLTLAGTNAINGTGNGLGNIIKGNTAANVLTGNAGDDVINGGGGFDRLIGGVGDDIFVFSSVEDIGTNANNGTIERIFDFRGTNNQQGFDLLDLTAIDADTTVAGHQSFDYANIITSGGFTANQAGKLRYVGGILEGNVNGDTTADFRLNLNTAYSNNPLGTQLVTVQNDTFLGTRVTPTLNTNWFVTNPTLSIARDMTFPANGNNEGDSGTVNHAFTVTLSRAVAVDTVVTWSVSGTGANAATADDFLNGAFPQGTVTIAAGQLTGKITVPVRGDLVLEQDETFQVSLGTATGGAVVGTTSTAVSTIFNDDAREVSILPAGTAILEGNSGQSAHTFTVTISQASPVDTIVNWSVTGSGVSAADGADFGGTLPSGTVTILAGQTSANIVVNASGDTTLESNDSFTVTLTGTSLGTQLGPNVTAMSTIVNDEARTVNISGPVDGVLEGNLGSSAHTFTVTMSSAALTDTVVNWSVAGAGGVGLSAADSADFGGSLPSGTVTILAGQTSATFNVNATGDLTPESNDSFTVTLTGTSAGTQLGTTLTANSTIIDDEGNAVSISGPLAPVTEGNTGTAPHQFAVRLERAVATATVVNYAVLLGSGAGFADAADLAVGTPLTGTVTIAAGQTEVILDVLARGDSTFEPNETFTVSLTGTSAGTQVSPTNGSATSTIANDDPEAPPVIFGLNNVGNAAANNVTGGAANDQLYGGLGNDTLSGMGGDDLITGDAGNDTLSGGDGNDILRGGAGNDRLDGGAGDDLLESGGGTDVLIGGLGADVLVGGTARQTMTGGEGADVFRFNKAITEIGTSTTTNDIITDFTPGVDKIDLSAIDADTRNVADSAFLTLIKGSAAFTAPGQLKLVQVGTTTNWQLQGNVNTTLTPDFIITLQNFSAEKAAAVTLGDFIV